MITLFVESVILKGFRELAARGEWNDSAARRDGHRKA